MSISKVSQVFQHSGRFVNDASEDRIVTRCSLSAERTQAHNNSDDRITSQTLFRLFDACVVGQVLQVMQMFGGGVAKRGRS